MPEQELKLRWGFELELAHVNYEYHNNVNFVKQELKDTIRIAKRGAIKIRWNTHWDIGLDFGIELRSKTKTITKNGVPIKTIDNKMMEEIGAVLKIMKENGYKPGEECGLHIHISSNQPITLRTLPIRTVWKTRERWCNSPRQDEIKYQLVNHLDKKHFEVRLFNSTTDLRCIVRNILFVLNNTVPVVGGKSDWTSSKHKIKFVPYN